ncbi:hypothetical protein [Streptomyces sp. NPDC057617]|uniref:hypothetical protein n=1 Tax=Streptomyces sp. NPDC057617 TaxID=3346184 RepID=UPI0036AF175B
MVQQPNPDGSTDNTLEEIGQLAPQCDILMREYEQQISELEASLREVRDKHAQVASVREETRTALASVHSVRDRAEKLGLLTFSPPGTSHLRVVPDAPATPAPSADTPTSRVFLVRGEKTKQILTLLATRPDALWASGDVATLLGLAKDDREGRRRLRGTIRNLADRGMLERVLGEGGKNTYYRPLLNWKFEHTT